MKKCQITGLLMAAVLLCANISCSDDAEDISNVTTLNMYNVENGKTVMGNSDIYINTSYNFETSNCYLVELGTSKNLGKALAPQIYAGLVQETAVVPGHLYQAFPAGSLVEFPSGEHALSLSGDYYQFFVEDKLTKEQEAIGATVRFAYLNPDENGLPEYGSTIYTVSSWDELEGFSYSFPEDTEVFCSDETEYAFTCTVDRNRVTLSASTSEVNNKSFGIYARRGTVCTKVYLAVDIK